MQVGASSRASCEVNEGTMTVSMWEENVISMFPSLTAIVWYCPLVLPSFFEQMAQLQFEQACKELEIPLTHCPYNIRSVDEGDVLVDMTKIKNTLYLLASCESTYNMMTYLEPQWIQKNHFSNMYGKLVVSLRLISDDLRGKNSMVLNEINIQTAKRKGNNLPGKDVFDPSTLKNVTALEKTKEKIDAYIHLFERAASLFQVNCQLIKIYRDFALSSPPFECSLIPDILEANLKKIESLESEILQRFVENKKSELLSLLFGLRAKQEIETYSFHKSLINLLKLNGELRTWKQLLEETMEEPDDETTIRNTAIAEAKSPLREKDVHDLTDRVVKSDSQDEMTSRSVDNRCRQSFTASLKTDLRHLGKGASSSHGTDSGNTTDDDEAFRPPIYMWSKKLYNMLLAKYSLYFYKTLGALETPSLLMSLAVTPTYIKTITEFTQTFQVKGGEDRRPSIALILNTNSLKNVSLLELDGYACPMETIALRPIQQDRSEDLTLLDEGDVEDGGEQENIFSSMLGLGTWPAVFWSPHAQPPIQHWPNIISLILYNEGSFINLNPIFCHFERRMNTTYFIVQIDASMYFVLIFEEKRKQNDRLVQESFGKLLEQLQLLNVFKQGQ